METERPLNLDELGRRFSDVFGISGLRSATQTQGGFMCRNFRVETDAGPYFLKQYRNRISTVVHEIKRSERFFAGRGIPIILPLPDRDGRSAFWFDGSWFSLFPFVPGTSPTAASLSGPVLESLAKMLARIHQAGQAFGSEQFMPLRLWDRDMFSLESVEIQRALLAKPSRTPFDEAILDLIRFKQQFVEENELSPRDISLPFDTLLHGDFIYQNVFVDAAGEVTHVYDLEKTCIGPRAYELARSLVVTCFDDGWDDQHFIHARRFLSAYREAFPIGYDEFLDGFRLYRTSVIHMTWIESSFVLHDSMRYKNILGSHARRIRHLAEDPEAFVDRLWA